LGDSTDEWLLDEDYDPDAPAWQRTTKKLKRFTQKMTGMEPNEVVAKEAYQEGETLFREKKYDEAADRFKYASKRWPDSDLEEDSLFMLAESYFFADRYSSACDSYVNLMKKFENSRYLDKVVPRQFAIARYWEQHDNVDHHWVVTPNFADKTRPWFDTRGNALAAYETVHLNDPTGPLADDSLMAKANSHFLNNEFEDADTYYTMLRDSYPQSEHQPAAHLLGVRSKMRKYQGAAYDGAPLGEAKELIDQVNSQFPNELTEEKVRLREADRAIRTQQAQRDFELGEYYAGTRHFGAARFYYGRVIKEFPDTRFSDAAQERIELYKDRADNPKNYFKWLTDLVSTYDDD
jgi:outer membrane protein assembly factor BamD (BamD/ComL family)